MAASPVCYADEKPQPNKADANQLTGYDMTLSSGANTVRIVKTVGNGVNSYLSFANGLLIAKAQMPVDAEVTAGQAADFNQYLKTSATVMESAGVNPNVAGIRVMSPVSTLSADDERLRLAHLDEANKNKGQPANNHMTVTSGINQ
ncbi:MAG: hypothetical protein QM647_02375 [Asticcacaulis sp.]|uniref:hypothetical protein n=1 Tax=Asticcacaulis sp. TaxID=1872648 RepID=UPI0039E21548